jgi:hypothetical protein
MVPSAYYLGPMGNPNPSEFIIKETNQIPFKTSTIDPASWTTKLPFRNWPKMPKGWRNWYRRVFEKKGDIWENLNLSQCLNLSLSKMEKNEPLLTSTCYFWTNSINAFIFGHGPMTLTLADVHMLTGLQITRSLSPLDLLNTGSKKLPKIAEYMGWVSYIKKNQGTSPNVDEKEHVAFMLMWLERFVFCGSSCGPVYNHKYLAKRLVAGDAIPLGKYLLGAAYHLLN